MWQRRPACHHHETNKASGTLADVMKTPLNSLHPATRCIPEAQGLAASDSHLPPCQEDCPWLMGAILPEEAWGSVHSPQEGPLAPDQQLQKVTAQPLSL